MKRRRFLGFIASTRKRHFLIWFVIGSPMLAEVPRATDLTYLGTFNLPPPDTGSPRWGYGALALAYDEQRDALLGSAHVQFNGCVAWASIPDIGQRAEPLTAFTDVRGTVITEPAFTRLDRLGGLTIIDDRVWASFFVYYAVANFRDIDFPSFISNSRALDDARGLFKAGPYGDPVFSQKRTSNYLFTFPEEWADQHVKGFRLGAGKGDGPGNAGNSRGPPIYAISTTATDGILGAIPLVHYPPPPAEPSFPWSPCDRWEGAVWAHGSVLIAGRRGRGPVCYGTPEECSDACGGGKGYHCHPYGAEILFYSSADLAASAAGLVEPHQVQPYDVMDITPQLESCDYELGGMAYDTRRQRLYLVQQNKEHPIVHVWQFAKQKGHMVSVSIDGGESMEFDGTTRTEAIGRAVEFLGKEVQSGHRSNGPNS